LLRFDSAAIEFIAEMSSQGFGRAATDHLGDLLLWGTHRHHGLDEAAMVILNARDGKILTSLPLAGGSDGAAFNPTTMEAFSTHGNGTLTVIKENSPTSFEVEQNLQTMNGARTITFDSKTNHILTMSQERGPAPPPPPGGGRPPQGTPVPGSFTILMIGK
jgi:hypothetical protein